MAPQQITLRAVADLQPYARNTRTHSEQQVLQIAASIREFGFNNPVLIAPDGQIIAGHGRVMAAQSLGLQQVPCVVLGHLSPEQRRAYVIADNRIAELAEWDQTMLQSEMADLALAGFGADLLGFSDADLDLLDAGGFDERAADANAAGSVSDELSPEGENNDNSGKKTRTVYPLVLALSRAQYERWQRMKKVHNADDVQLLDMLMVDDE